MQRRTPIDGRVSLPQNSKLLLAFAAILLPWAQVADGQQQQRQSLQNIVQSLIPQASEGTPDNPARHDPIAAAVLAGRSPVQWEDVDFASNKFSKAESRRSSPNEQHDYQRQLQHQQHARRSPHQHPTNNYPREHSNKNHHPTDHLIAPDDPSALATFAPAKSVRAPSSSRHQKLSGSSASGLTSPQHARSLEDWEVEDFVLLATVDGDLFANDRKTGKELWHLQVDQPMVETIHHRTNKSVLDEDFSPVDHYIWAIEPTRDGGVYVWVPEREARPRATGFSMKELVEVLSPYSEEETSIVYVGDKKTTMMTLDAATGRVIKWFGAGGSHVNEPDSCLKPNALFNKESEECSSIGTITLGRTEYTVSINRLDGKGIATLRYSEWTPNNRDSDLFHQYHVSKDSKYITTRHDGKVYAFDYGGPDTFGPLFSQTFAAPVARVFDVCRPWDAGAESNPDLVLLPQPAMPSQNEDMALKRSNSIFLNRTEEGSWYALSGRAYPLIVGAPLAKASSPGWWDETAAWESLTEAKVSKDLIGTHSLANLRRDDGHIPTLPQGPISGHLEDPDNKSFSQIEGQEALDEPTIVDKVKGLPKSAANSVVEFVRNPILIIIFFIALVYNQQKLRRAYFQFRNGSSIRDTLLHLSSDAVKDGKSLAREAKSSISHVETDYEPGTQDHPDQVLAQPSHNATPPETLGDGTRDFQHATNAEAEDELKPLQSSNSASEELEVIGETQSASGSSSAMPEKKKTRRGRRGGVKHRKGRHRDTSQSRDDEAPHSTVEEAVSNAKKLGDRPSLEPDVVTVANDMQAVSGSVIRMGNIEVNTDEQLGTGSNGTLVFAGKFDGREVAVKRMLIQFVDIASQETKLLRESDDHPNGRPPSISRRDVGFCDC